MKKTYIEPTTLMVKIHTTGLIATSLPKSVTKVDDNDEVLSREFDYYDDEEFEDE